MHRALRILGPVVVGALLAAGALVGLSRSEREEVPRIELLDLEGYCRDQHGPDAGAYQPDDPEGWRCTSWRNGVWGLDPVDLDAACRWQRGDDARLEEVRPEPGTGTRRALACAV